MHPSYLDFRCYPCPRHLVLLCILCALNSYFIHCLCSPYRFICHLLVEDDEGCFFWAFSYLHSSRYQCPGCYYTVSLSVLTEVRHVPYLFIILTLSKILIRKGNIVDLSVVRWGRCGLLLPTKCLLDLSSGSLAFLDGRAGDNA